MGGKKLPIEVRLYQKTQNCCNDVYLPTASIRWSAYNPVFYSKILYFIGSVTVFLLLLVISIFFSM